MRQRSVVLVALSIVGASLLAEPLTLLPNSPESLKLAVIGDSGQVPLFLFGLVNAGVPLKALYWGTLSLPVTTLIVKAIGLFVGVGFALGLGLHLPRRVGWRELTVLGFIATIGFTVALFVATASRGPGPTLSAMKCAPS